MRKTFKGWERSNKDLTDYLQVGDEIDEELYRYLGGVVAPVYCTEGLLQSGEPIDHTPHGVGLHMTASHVDGKYRYLGVLPEFKYEE